MCPDTLRDLYQFIYRMVDLTVNTVSVLYGLILFPINSQSVCYDLVFKKEPISGPTFQHFYITMIPHVSFDPSFSKILSLDFNSVKSRCLLNHKSQWLYYDQKYSYRKLKPPESLDCIMEQLTIFPRINNIHGSW